MTIIHSTPLTATADRTDTTMLEMSRMLRPACGQVRQLPSDTRLCLREAGAAHLLHQRGVFWGVVIDENAEGARHQGEDERFHDAAVRDGVLQSGEPLAEDVKQQRHHTQGCDAGARCHDDAGSGERKRSVVDLMVYGWLWAGYLRFMSPLKAREKMLDKVPPGQQPQMSTVTALTESICRSLARLKAVRGMMPNWASSAMATPFGFRRWALILESSMVQPREIIVMKRMVMVKISMVLFRVGEIFRTNALPFLEKFPSPEM